MYCTGMSRSPAAACKSGRYGHIQHTGTGFWPPSTRSCAAILPTRQAGWGREPGRVVVSVEVDFDFIVGGEIVIAGMAVVQQAGGFPGVGTDLAAFEAEDG